MKRIFRTVLASALLTGVAIGPVPAGQAAEPLEGSGYAAWAEVGGVLRTIAPGDVIAVGTANADDTCRYDGSPRVGAELLEGSGVYAVALDVVQESCTLRLASARTNAAVNLDETIDGIVGPAVVAAGVLVDSLYDTAKPPIRHHKAETRFSVFDGLGGPFDNKISETIMVSSWDRQGSRTFNGKVDGQQCIGYGSYQGVYIARVNVKSCSPFVYDREPPWTSLSSRMDRELVLPFVDNPVLDSWVQRSQFQATANGISSFCDFSETSPPGGSSWSCTTKRL